MNKLLVNTLSMVLLYQICAIPVEAQNLDTSLISAMEYRSIGPYRGGRSAAVTGVEGKPDLYYFGSTGGGVWRTEDGGSTWANISDGYFGGSIGAVAVAPSDPNVIYVGGGEETVRGNVSSGNGMYKSVDAGKTWTHIGLNDSRHISRIRIHPQNPDILYVAVMGNLYKSNEMRGVYKSIDGGMTWQRKLFANEDAGAVDLCLDPTNPRIMYATTWRIRRTPYSLSSGGKGSGIWKSTDSGETWKEITGNKGLPTDTLGIIGVTVSPVNPNRIWAIVESKTGGVFRSDNGGDTWTKLNEDRSLRQRAWYYTRIYADTKDVNTVYVMNVSYHKSTDGGKTFESSNAPHGDHHDLWIAPEDNQRMIIADDGGAQVSFDGGANWSTYYNQPTAQFYRLAVDNSFPYRIYAAQQDNSTVRIRHRTSGYSIDLEDWENSAGCECGHIAVDPLNNDIVYGGCYDGVIERLNHDIDQSRAVNVWPDNPMGHGAEGMKYRFQWNFPIFFSPHDAKKLYTASNHLHVSMDGGQNWEIISPDLTRNDSSKLVSSGGPITQDNTSVEYYCTIFAAAESPLEKDLLWVGSDDGLIHVSRDGGKNWKNVTPKGMPEWIMINSLEPDPHHEGGCYIAATAYKLGDFHPYLYKTSDYGETWSKITDGIDDEHFTRVVRSDPHVEGLLYAGTEAGMYISFNDGKKWSPFQLNLPIVPVTDLLIKDENLIVATQGRSLWIIDDLYPLYELNNVQKQSKYVFKPKTTYRMPGGQRKNLNTAGLNHPGGAMIYFYLDSISDSTAVSLTFTDVDGNEVRTFSTKEKKNDKLEVKKGSNLFVWNLQYPEAERFDGMIFWAGSLAGPVVLPGIYSVTLKAGDFSQTQSFEIKQDPRSESTFEDMQAQFSFIQEVNAKVSEAHKAIKQIRDVKNQLEKVTPALKKLDGTEEIIKMGDNIQKEISEIEEVLYQTKNRSNQDPLNFPIRLTNKLAYLNTISRGGDYAPTKQTQAVKQELSGKIDHELSLLRRIFEEELPKFNESYRSLDMDVLKLTENEKADGPQ
ncbi:MAG: glycosyl hydrolase [Saprospiraceae bacterium]|nr:glycosyl hydrolase [Saprospiraceae bacterium]